MEIASQLYREYTVHHFVLWESAKKMVDIVLDKTYHLDKTLKDSSRSMVCLISLNGESLILKEPVEKNERKWIRFTTLFRKSEALQSCLSMIKLQKIGIESNRPLVVVEKKQFGMVVDSWYLCSFVEGSLCIKKHYPDVVNTLQKIHRAGYLHGDAHLKNFLAGEKGIQIIDAKLSKPWNFAQKDLELAYLEKSCPAVNNYFNTKKLSYRFARFILYQIQGRFKSIKRQIRNIFRS